MAETAADKKGRWGSFSMRSKLGKRLTKAPPTIGGNDGDSVARKDSMASDSRGSSVSTLTSPFRKESTDSGPRKNSGLAFENPEWDDVRDKQTGERKDHTALLHSLVQHEEYDSDPEKVQLQVDDGTPKYGHLLMKRLSPKLWERITMYLDPEDIASLALSCKTLRDLLGPQAWLDLNEPENHQHKLRFLVHMHKHLPKQLLCTSCTTFHLRTHPGEEFLKPSNVLNPVFACPNASDPKKKAPRTRITPGRTLPFTFVQLVTRHHCFGPSYGISTESLSRRWTHRDSSWSHHTRYMIHTNNHLLMRVVSTCFASPGLPPSGLRYLLYSREDFTPYFSVCAHWRDGLLMDNCKCALGHIPIPPRGAVEHVQNRVHRPKPIVALCGNCKPMRRCPQCPTEYLIELSLREDTSDTTVLFKQALIVTRWSDLGDGTRSPLQSPEWLACNGEGEYDGVKSIGRRAVSGVFESHFNPEHIPGQRILNLNPDGKREGEEGHGWY